MQKVVYVLCFISSVLTYGQSTTLEKINDTVLATDQFISVDKFNALYHIENNVLFKSDVHNKYQFSALQLGRISSVDLLNPLKITLFYESSNTAVVLDNTLNEITRINFSTIENFRNVSHATTAGDRRFWIFNTDLQQLEIFDWNTENVITQFPPMDVNASSLVSNFNFAWISNKQGLFYYNNYGSFLEKMEIPETTLILQDRGAVIAFAKAQLYYKPNNASEFSIIETPDLTIKQLSLNGEILYLYDGQKLTTFRLKLAKQP